SPTQVLSLLLLEMVLYKTVSNRDYYNFSLSLYHFSNPKFKFFSPKSEKERERERGATMTGEEQEQYQRSFSKIEEALEVKSLRRIISAYLNYEDAAEEDVRRYERSFRRLPNAHKALLSNFPLKCERLRRYIIDLIHIFLYPEAL
ncbi:hypothetical protein GIB67_023878, partial [Kingdonia uniflora]